MAIVIMGSSMYPIRHHRIKGSMQSKPDPTISRLDFYI